MHIRIRICIREYLSSALQWQPIGITVASQSHPSAPHGILVAPRWHRVDLSIHSRIRISININSSIHIKVNEKKNLSLNI